MGGGAEAPIAAIELFGHKAHGSVGLGLAARGGLIGAISLSGSLIAWGKLDGRINKTLRLAGLQAINGTLLLVLVATGAYIVRSEEHTSELQSLMRISYAVFCLKKTIRCTNSESPRPSL